MIPYVYIEMLVSVCLGDILEFQCYHEKYYFTT